MKKFHQRKKITLKKNTKEKTRKLKNNNDNIIMNKKTIK